MSTPDWSSKSNHDVKRADRELQLRLCGVRIAGGETRYLLCSPVRENRPTVTFRLGASHDAGETAAMKLSVAMATYNGERFLREQLGSLAAQARLPDELVVCDDRSNDGAVSMLEEFRASTAFQVVCPEC